MSLLLITHPVCTRHDMGPGHPESPARLLAVNEALQELMADPERAAAVQWRDAEPASRAHLARAHHPSHVAAILDRQVEHGLVQLDPDTAMNPFTAEAALHAAGAVVMAVDAVCNGNAARAFCAVRPPGHHAERDRPMGFCFFNNVAVGALHALDACGLSRVAVVDFDVHHGNGTEDIFQAEPRVLMASTFQSGLYPGSGDQPLGPNMKNVPLPAGSSGQAARQACELQWIPQIREFAPELIMISAGFDAHAEDQLAGLNWHEADYAWLTSRLVELSVELGHGRIVSVLEGGYALAALGRSAAAHVNALLAQPETSPAD